MPSQNADVRETVLLITDWTNTMSPTTFLTTDEHALVKHGPAWREAEFARGRVTAKVAALVVTGTPPTVLEILRARDGAPRPLVRGSEPSWRLSISHSGPTCAVVVGPRGPLGVDAQPRDSRDHALARRMCGPADRVPRDVDPTVVIACKEAAYKACRQGRSPLGYGLCFHDTAGIIVRPPRHSSCDPLVASVHTHGEMIIAIVSAGVVPERVLIEPEPRILRRLREWGQA